MKTNQLPDLVMQDGDEVCDDCRRVDTSCECKCICGHTRYGCICEDKHYPLYHLIRTLITTSKVEIAHSKAFGFAASAKLSPIGSIDTEWKPTLEEALAELSSLL